jgi:hypothetical protein
MISHAEAVRRYETRHRAAGLCVKCAEPAEPGSPHCRGHRERRRKPYCPLCGRPRQPFREFCAEHDAPLTPAPAPTKARTIPCCLCQRPFLSSDPTRVRYCAACRKRLRRQAGTDAEVLVWL